MTATEPQTVLIGTFADRARAEHFIEELRREGFRDDQIGVATPGAHEHAHPVGESALAGALTGGTMGVLAGIALAAAGLLPGVGPVLAGGLLAGSLGGAAVGAAAGGLLGVLLALGVPEDQAEHYEGQLRAGRTLVVVKAPARTAEALGILRRCEADELAAADH
jgi:hypothetical protein